MGLFLRGAHRSHRISITPVCVAPAPAIGINIQYVSDVGGTTNLARPIVTINTGLVPDISMVSGSRKENCFAIDSAGEQLTVNTIPFGPFT